VLRSLQIDSDYEANFSSYVPARLGFRPTNASSSPTGKPKFRREWPGGPQSGQATTKDGKEECQEATEGNEEIPESTTQSCETPATSRPLGSIYSPLECLVANLPETGR